MTSLRIFWPSSEAGSTPSALRLDGAAKVIVPMRSTTTMRSFELCTSFSKRCALRRRMSASRVRKAAKRRSTAAEMNSRPSTRIVPRATMSASVPFANSAPSK